MGRSVDTGDYEFWLVGFLFSIHHFVRISSRTRSFRWN